MFCSDSQTFSRLSKENRLQDRWGITGLATTINHLVPRASTSHMSLVSAPAPKRTQTSLRKTPAGNILHITKAQFGLEDTSGDNCTLVQDCSVLAVLWYSNVRGFSGACCCHGGPQVVTDSELQACPAPACSGGLLFSLSVLSVV